MSEVYGSSVIILPSLQRLGQTECSLLTKSFSLDIVSSC